MTSGHVKSLDSFLPSSVLTLVSEQDRKTPIVFLTEDSRLVQPKTLFTAIKGTQSDGHEFITMAIQKGATTILCSAEFAESDAGQTLINAHPDVIFIPVTDPQVVYAQACSGFFDNRPEQLVAVTGTNGKSSTVDFCRSLWQKMGYTSASMGTLGVISDVLTIEGSHTTPPPFTLHKNLNTLAEKGVTHLALEASSHGLCQNRLTGLLFQATAFLNLTHDHLDYHGTMEEYAKAKALLFQHLLDKSGTAVVYADDPVSQLFIGIAQNRGIAVETFGLNGDTIKVLSHTPENHGQVLELSVQGSEIPYKLHLPLVGLFQGMNVLAACLLVQATTKIPLLEILNHAQTLNCVKGRLDHVAQTPKKASVFVDYAHTPDALEKALQALRPHTDKKLWVVFGCGGNRDNKKRPVMGDIAQRLADCVIVTDDNPRYEDPETIRNSIMIACPDAQNIGDRKKAITFACDNASEGDIILVAGKGHEAGQIVAGITHPFEDDKVITEVCNLLKIHHYEKEH